MISQRHLIYLPILFFIHLGPNSLAQDWPQWRGKHRDGKVTEFKAPENWPVALRTVWNEKVGLGDASPALADGKLYLFVEQEEAEVTLCLDASTGQVLWKDQFQAPMSPGIYNDPLRFQHPGPRSSPTVSGDKLLTLGVTGILSCLDTETGMVNWRCETFSGKVPKFFTAMSPLVIKGLCYAHLGSSNSGSLLALDLETGEKVWEWTGEGPSYSSPVSMEVNGERILVVQTEISLSGFDPVDGKLLWSIPTPLKSTSFYCATTPVIDGETIYYTGQGWGTRAVKIEVGPGGYVVSELWNKETFGCQYNTPVLKEGKLYGLTRKRQLFCLDAEDGHLIWKDEKRNDAYGAIVDAGPVLIALPGNADLIFFRPDVDHYQEIARYEVSPTPCYAHPIIAGTSIYIKEKEHISLLRLR